MRGLRAKGSRSRVRVMRRRTASIHIHRWAVAIAVMVVAIAWLVRTPTGWANRGAAGTAFALGRDGTVGDLDGVAPDGGAA